VKYFNKIFIFCFLFCVSAFSQTPVHWENIIDATDTWKYFIPSEELPVNWTNPDFDDTNWSSGPGGIGYGDNDDNTLIPVNTISVYLRRNFFLADSSQLIAAYLYVDYDDAFVAYLNGMEIARANIGTENVRPAFNASSIDIVEPMSVSGGIPTKFPIQRTKLVSALRNGINTLALQVHNRSATSSDLSSTTYFFGGFNNSSDDYRTPPSWFILPPSITSYLPIITIDTWGGNIVDEPKTDAWIKVINNGEGKINDVNDPGTDFEGYIGIEIRGQSSQNFPKLGYGLETRNQFKEDSSVSLLTMPKESDWILSAPYSDKSLMRNPLTYYLGNRMGRWQPRTKWCELYLNDNYRGVYLLEEKIKRDKNRVKIDRLEPPFQNGDSLSGGYIVKVDKLGGLSANDFFSTTPLVSYKNARHYAFTYVYPKPEDISPGQKTYIKDFLTEFETNLNGNNFKDPLSGFRSYIDEMSFAEYEIIQELSNNVDGYRFSTFFYKESDSKGGKLIAGPLWDFDLCYGNVDYSPRNLATNTWLYPNYGPNEGYPMHWWARLMEDSDYQYLVKKRYSQLRSGPLNTDSIISYLDDNATFLGDAINRNFERWPILDQYVWPNSYIGDTYENEMDYLKTWIINRLTWLDSKWLIPLTNDPGIQFNNFISVYPNPFNNSISISSELANFNNITVEISAIQGQRLFSQNFFNEKTNAEDIHLDNLNFPSGMYLLFIYKDGKIIAHSKLICTKTD
jgi:hypothetical protein